MTLSEKTSDHTFYASLRHAVFLPFGQNFTDIDTIIPAMLVEAGGGPVHVGIMSAIMTGGAGLLQKIGKCQSAISHCTWNETFVKRRKNG
jgi:hypothetical protein